MAALDHPNVVPLYEAGEEDGTVYIVTRWVDGTELGDADPARRPAASPARAARIAAQIASALEVAHEKGLVHRDVKPSNVIVTSEDHVYLTDFGLTKRAESASGLTGAEQMLGTIDYVAPEQIEGGEPGARGDVYGARLRALRDPDRRGALRGRDAAGWPRCGRTSTPSRRPCASSGPTCPQALDDVIRRGLAKRPDDRPTAAAFGAAVLDGRGRGALTPTSSVERVGGRA